jgi:hypothetical protein
VHDRVSAEASGAQEHDAGAPDMLLGRVPIRNDGLKPGTIWSREDDPQ